MQSNLIMKRNTPIDTDAYKQCHYKAIEPKLEYLYSYGESRVDSKYPQLCWLGLDIAIQQNFLEVPSKGDLIEAREETFETFGYDIFNMEVWEKVRKLGYFPMTIKSAPEGSVIPTSNVLFTAEATEPWFAKTINSLEGLEMHSWYASTISTRVMNIKRRLIPLVLKSGTIELLPYMVNDFGFRGATGYESAYVGGLAHLLHFEGSDNMPASRAIKNYYGLKGRAKSVWATEHSVALSFGPGEGEYRYVNHQLDNAPDEAIVAMVIDTYDAINFMQNVVGDPTILAKIKAKKGRIVFRPDSGIPKIIVEQVLEILAGHFGYTINAKGYKILNDNVGVIQGDGMNEDTIIELYEAILGNRWSSDNLVVGSGGGLLQVDVNRDTQRFAIKPSFGVIDGKDTFFRKTPKTDMTKASKSGKLKLHPQMNGNYLTISSEKESGFGGFIDDLKPVFHNGEFMSNNNFADMIARADQGLKYLL